MRYFALATGLLLAASVAALWDAVLIPGPPASSPILLDRSGAVPGADRADLPPAPTDGRCVRLGFVGDIMQHRAQAGDDFADSYGRIAPLIRGFDFAVGNLEFPVDPTRPVGPEPGAVRFNGSGPHLDALAGAGFDALITANNHSFDQGHAGLRRTLEEVERRRLRPLGTASSKAGLAVPGMADIGGVRVGLAAFTRPVNAYLDDAGEYTWPTDSLPLLVLNFSDWTREYRDQGRRLFQSQVAAGRAAGAELLVALAHWGEEWHFGASHDQRRAAHDMIDAGFDLVVGMHSHVLGPAEVYRGRLIAYSLGTFISDFRPLAARTGAILAVDVRKGADGRVAVSDFQFQPVLVQPGSHVVHPLGAPQTDEQEAAWALAREMLGGAARSWKDARGRCRLSS